MLNCRLKTGAFPGVAQLVARLIWDQEAAGSSPVTRILICPGHIVCPGLFLYPCSGVMAGILFSSQCFHAQEAAEQIIVSFGQSRKAY